MSDWDNSDGEDSKSAAPVQTQRYDQNRGYGNDQKRDYGNDHRRDYNQQRDNRYDNAQNYGGGRQQQNYGGGRQQQNYAGGRQPQQNQNYANGPRRDDNFRSNSNRGAGGGGGFNRYGGNDFKMEVDSNKVGMIIGKGGSKIREMQENHSVYIKIGK